MTDPETALAGPGLSLTVTVSCEPGFFSTVEALAARVGEYAGCAAQSAQNVARAIACVIDCASQPRLAGKAPPAVDITFRGNGHGLRIDLAWASPPPRDKVFAEIVRANPASASLHGLVDGVEFGQAEGCSYCRLTQQV